MSVLDYTTYSEVRATLGVTAEELEDSTIMLDMYNLALLADLQDIGLELPEDFAEVDAIDADDRTEAEQLFHDAVKLFAPYAVGVQLSAGLPLFAPKSITDGKAAISRDSGSPHKLAIAACLAMFNQARARLIARYGQYGGVVAAVGSFRSLMRVVPPALDPVLGA